MTITPRLARWAVTVIAAGAVLATALATHGGGASTRAAEIRVDYVFSKDARKLLEPLVARFNAEDHRIDGRRVRIVGNGDLSSGEAEAAISTRKLRPALWTPASSLWGGLLDHDAGTRWVAPGSTSLVASPQVIAIWKPFARALGWPNRAIGWRDIVALATSSRGWAAYGHPELDPFKLGHTNPEFSTSGLSAVASEYYAVTGKHRGLTLADIRRPAVRADVRSIEHSIVHYGETAAAFTAQMDLNGTPYAHAVYVQQTQVIAFNKTRRQATQLVGIVPAEGTFVADYPLIALRVPWVGVETRAAARLFTRWLVPHITPALAKRNDFRVRKPASIKLLQPPPPAVLAAIRAGWRQDRKPANIVLVVDTSNSMAGAGRLDAAKAALLSFVRGLSARDRVALVTSGSKVSIRVPMGRNRAAVVQEVRSLLGDGTLPVFNAVSRALDIVNALHDTSRINAVVVLSDGAGTSTGYRALLAAIRAHPVTEGTSTRVFTVAYGEKADSAALKNIATLTGGAFYSGGPDDVQDVYRKISSYF